MKRITLLACAAGLLVQGCGSIPHVITKKAITTLPAAFRPGVVEPPRPALIEWKEFFSDPDLVALIDVAIANNKEVQVMMQRISIARNEVAARRGEYLPFVRLDAGAGGDKVGRFTRDGAVEEGLPLISEKRETVSEDGQPIVEEKVKPFPTVLGDFQLGLSATWELDVWKKLRNATKVAVLDYMATQEGRSFLITNLVAEVARSYYELMALDNQLENLSQNIAYQQSGLDMVRQLMINARSNALAVKRYEAEVAKNEARRFEIAQQITLAENRLNFLLGRTPEPIQRSSARFMDFKPPALLSGVPSELLRNRPDLRRAELELQAAELDIEVARANFYPSFAIRARAGYHAFSLKYLLKTPESIAASLAGDMVAPLVNKRAIVAEYKSASARQIQAAYEYERTILNAFTEVANQLSNIENLEKSFARKRQQVDLLIQSIDVASQLFKSARVEYLEVLLTQRESLEAKTELIETRQKQIVAIVDLYRALGGGWK